MMGGLSSLLARAKRHAGVALAAAIVSCASLDGLTGGRCGDGFVDGSEQCDGDRCCTSECTLAVAGTVCREGAGACDVAETCDGKSAACPADAFAAAGTTCRPATASCDPVETCSGTTAECPADVGCTPAALCRPGAACQPGQTCTANDDLGCGLVCHCADDDTYSCSSTCCPTPAVHGKTCTTANATCRDACTGSCKCENGTWNCASTTCAACPITEDLPTGGASSFVTVGTTCSYALASAVRRCVTGNRDASSNAWTCSDVGSTGCPEAAVSGKTCTQPTSIDGTPAACSDACGQRCTCQNGLWSCPAGCNACPSADDQITTGTNCLSSANTVCTYATPGDPPGPLAKCTCTSKDAATNEWSCVNQPSSTCATPAAAGRTCTIGDECGDACGQRCTCPAGQWSCPAACAACPSIEDLPLQGTTCLAAAGTKCTYVTPQATTVCNCVAAGATNQWSCP